MCIQHTVILTALCKWKRPKWLFFVVKRYAVREAKKWRYAVRNAKIEWYAVRKGGGVCHPLTWKSSTPAHHTFQHPVTIHLHYNQKLSSKNYENGTISERRVA